MGSGVSNTLKRILAGLIVLLAIGLSSCIYPDLKEFPEEDRTLYLFNFSNSTFDADTQVELNRILREEIHSKKDFLVGGQYTML